MALTAKQRFFCLEYLKDLNATQAAIRAGYSPQSADRTGPELLGKTCVSDEIARQMAERSSRTQLHIDNVLREVARLAFSDIGDIVDFTGDTPRLRKAKDIPADARRAIQSIKIKRVKGRKGERCHVEEIKLWPKPNAIEKAMKHLGLTKEPTTLEAFLASLPPELGRMLSAALARHAGGGSAASPGITGAQQL